MPTRRPNVLAADFRKIPLAQVSGLSYNRVMAFETINHWDEKLVSFAATMRKIPRITVRCEIYDGIAIRVDERHARNIFKKLFPCATQDGVLCGLETLRARLEQA